MPWRPLPRIAFAIAIYPFEPSEPNDLPLELGDELYIIEEGGKDWSWCRGYLVAPPSILSGLTNTKGQHLEARVYSGIFPKACVEVREMLEDPTAQIEETGHANGFAEKSNGDAGEDGDSPRKEDHESAEDADEEESAEDESLNGDQKLKKAPNKLGRAQITTTEIKSETSQPASLTPTDTPESENRQKPPPPIPLLKIGDETPSLLSEPLVDEIASCLKEWQMKKLHELLLARKYAQLDKLGKIVQRVDLGRRQLLHEVLTDQELEDLREKTVWDLVSGNKLVGAEVIVRDPRQRGRSLTGNDDPIEVAKLQSIMSLLDKWPSQPSDRVNLHHVLFELKDATSYTKEKVSIVAYICSKKPEEPVKLLSEPFQLDVPSKEPKSKAGFAKMRSLFADLSALDIGETSGSDLQVYLVIKVQVQFSHHSKPSSIGRLGSVRDSPARPQTSHDGRTQSLKSRGSLMWGQKKHSTSLQQKPLPPIIDENTPSGGNPATENETSRKSSSQGSASSQKAMTADRDAGIAVFSLSKKFLEDDQEVEKTVTVWTPSESHQETHDQPFEADFLKDHFPSASGFYEPSKLVNPVSFRLHSLIDPDTDDLIRTRPTLLQNVVKTPKIGFSGAPTKQRSDIYLTLAKPNFPGQALFSHPERGAVPIHGIADMHNFQLTLEVRKSSGERVERCIFPSSDSTGHTAWRTTAIPRSGSWAQTIRLVIPSEDVPDCHIIMSLASFPDFPFALCWMPLWKGGAFVQDGTHLLLLHEYNKITSGAATDGRGGYLDLAWDSKSKDAINRESWSAHMSNLQVDSFLCSTALTQDQVLLGLLRWKEYPNDQLLLLLRQVVFVPEIEIVKLVSDTLDALFSILVDRSGNDEFEDLVFNALVTVLSIVHDRRFHLDPLVNEYADLRFNYPFATPCLIRSYLRLIARRADYQNSRQLRATLKVGRQIIKFIIVARKQQKAKEAGIGITNNETVFMRDFKKIFEALEDQMRDESPSLIGSKTLIVQHLHTWLPELLSCFSQEEILSIGTDFVDACAHVTGKLILHKLVLIWNFAKLSASLEPELRVRLDAKVEEWIAPHWGTVTEPDEQYREQVRLCCSIVALKKGDHGEQGPRYYVKILQSYHYILQTERPKAGHLSLLFPSTYPFPTRPTSCPRNYDEALIELSALKANFKGAQLSKDFGGPESDVTPIIRMALELNLSVMREEAFPKTWLTLYVYHHRIIFDLLDALFRVMVKNHLPPPDDASNFDTEMWRSLLLALLELVRSESLALEILPEQKRKTVWKIVGDIRQSGAELLGRIWNALGWDMEVEEREQYFMDRNGGFQVQYVPSLVGPILELCLSVHEGLRRCAVEILQSMIISEWDISENIDAIQNGMIYALDELFRTKNIGESAQNRFFIEQLLSLFEPFQETPENRLWEAAKELVSLVDQLLDLLIAMHTPDQHESLRIMNTLRLMDFLRGLERDDVFIDYVHQLANVEVKSHNFREAGLALRLHADLYNWDLSKTVKELKSPPFPSQTAFERKESLYFEMIKYFEEGGAWGSALDCYRELAHQYEHTSFDFVKLARTQRSTARVYELIAKGEGGTSRYFRVVFRGLGFPANLRGREFIYEGNGSERLQTFTDRLQQQHPAAQISSKTDVDNDEGQYLHIMAVSTHRELDHPAYLRSRVSLSTKEFIISSTPDKFAVTSKRHSPKSGVQDQWVEKTVYTTAATFPTILRRSEVIKEEVVPLSPLETAIERTVRKTFEMFILQKRVRDGDKISLTTLIDAIKGSVDPTSSTSVSQYHSVLNKHSDDASNPLVISLRTALLDFASILKNCLADLSRTSHQLEHKNFSILFQSTFAPEIASLNSMAPAPMITPFAPDPELVLPPSSLNLPDDLANGYNLSTPRAAEAPHVHASRHSFLESGRGRLNSLLRRSITDVDASYHTHAHTPNHSQSNGTIRARSASHSKAGTTRPSISADGTPSRTSSRQSTQNHSGRNGSGNGVWRSSEDAGPAPKSSHGRSRKESDPRPATAHSAAPSSVKTAGGGSSIRKRLSTFGISRKASKLLGPGAGPGAGVGVGNGVLKEE